MIVAAGKADSAHEHKPQLVCQLCEETRAADTPTSTVNAEAACASSVTNSVAVGVSATDPITTSADDCT